MTKNSHQSIVDVVELYRTSNFPSWDGEKFEGKLNDFESSRELLLKLRKQDPRSGSLRELSVDNVIVSEGEELPERGNTAEFVFVTGTDRSSRFFRNSEELARDYRLLGRGELPDRFYLLEDNYLHGSGDSVPDKINLLKDLTKFINNLSLLADQKYVTEGSRAWTLVFQTGDKLSQLETKFGDELLNLHVPNSAWKVVKNLSTQMDDIHQMEKLSLFKVTICEYLGENAEFHDFIRNAETWERNYKDHLSRYLNNFSFEEVKRKIAEEHTRFAERISGMLEDITTKILSLPLAAVIVMVVKIQSSRLPEWFLMPIVFFVSWALHNLVAHHLRTLPEIEKNIDMAFGRLKTHDSGARKDLKDDGLKEVLQSLDRELKKLKSILRIYQWVIWIAFLVGCVILFCFTGDPTTDQPSKLLNHVLSGSGRDMFLLPDQAPIAKLNAAI